jgi:hypothetical protein
MGQTLVYQYTIPLEQTEKGVESAYSYPEESVIDEYDKGRYRIVIQDSIIPHFHRESIAVEVDVLVEDEAKSDAKGL